MSAKITLSIIAIGLTMLVTAVISILEYRRMSSYVTEEIAKDIECINVSQKIAATTESFNLRILSIVGDADSLAAIEKNNFREAVRQCEDVFLEIADVQLMPLTDTLLDSFVDYLDCSEELSEVIVSDFINTRNWFFFELQPVYNDFTKKLDLYNEDVHKDLMDKAEQFQYGFYRSIIPSVVSVGAGLLLLLLLLFFILAYYVKPINRMLDSLDNFLSRGRKYAYDFDGDDQLRQLNVYLTDLCEENGELKRRLKNLKENNNQ